MHTSKQKLKRKSDVKLSELKILKWPSAHDVILPIDFGGNHLVSSSQDNEW